MTSIQEVAEGRHPAVVSLARWLVPNPNLPEDAKVIAHIYHDAGMATLLAVPSDDPELTAGLRKLVEAKDCAVRARLAGLAG